MAFCRVVFPLLVLSVISCYASNVPLYMWGMKHEPSTKANPLQPVTESQVKSLLKCDADQDNLILVFVEKTLSVEDFSRKNNDGETSFPYLHKELPNAIYLPSVQHPLQALKECAGKSMTSMDLSGLPEEIGTEYSEIGNFVFIPLEDAIDGESRSDLLSRHDDFMSEIVSNMQNKYKTVVAIYTAHFPSWSVVEAPMTHSRVRRAAGNSRTYTVDGLGLYVQSITLKSDNSAATLATLGGQHTEFNPTNMTSKLDFENSTSITLNFYRSNGYWYFDSILLAVDSLKETLMPVGDTVYGIEGYSYRCGQDVTFTSSNQSTNYAITFQNLKIQPFFESTNETVTFGESMNCVGYFSAPIWSALLVVTFLLAITFYGIMMMLDIRTMDRFDDPKGKTITINTAE